MKVADFIDELALRLRDVKKRQWNQTFLVNAMNSAFTAMCNAIPASHTVEMDIILAEGTRQKLHDRLHRIVDILYNVDAKGGATTPVTNADRGALDTSAPTWRTDPSRDGVRHWIPSDVEESTFDVWPRARAGMGVHGVFTAVPVVSLSTTSSPVKPPLVVVPEKPVLPQIADYTVNGTTSSPSDGHVYLQFIDEDPFPVPTGGWQIPDGTILDVVFPPAILAGNIAAGAALNFDHIVNSYLTGPDVKDNDDYTRIYHGDPIAETGNYILDTMVAFESRSVGATEYTVAVFPVLDGTFDGARFDAISDGVNYAWLTGKFSISTSGVIDTTALVSLRRVGFHAFWHETQGAWVISDGVERVSNS